MILVSLFQVDVTAPGATNDRLLRNFNEVAKEASRVQQTSGADAAIRFFERALEDPQNDNFGQFHLRLGQMYKAQNKHARSAYHFLKCHQDNRVAAVDRDYICWDGFRDVTVPLTIIALPPKGQVFVVEPVEFAGAFKSGARLPRGRLVLSVEVPNHRTRRSELALNGPTTWRAQLGMLEREGPLVPDGFIERVATTSPPPEPVRTRAVRWPSYVLGAAGLALVGTGIFVGIDNQDTLVAIRRRQATNTCASGTNFCNDELDDAKSRAYLADGLWSGGSVFLATSLILWFVLDGDEGEATQ